MNSGQSQTAELQSLSGLEIVTAHLRRRPGNIYLLSGHSHVFTASLMIGSAANQPIAVIDGAMRFNSYTISRIAELLRVPPKILLGRTYVTRSFTAFQTEAAITTKLPRFLETTPCRIVIILGLLDTYYDEQVKPHECQNSLQRIMRSLKELTKRNIHVLIADVEVSNPPPGKVNLFQLIHHAADVVMSLQPDEYGFQLCECLASPKEERKRLPWDATMIPSRLSSTSTETRGANSEEH